VVEAVQSATGGDPTGRPGKSTPAIVDKLQRSTMRLSQMQDIAGCRLVVSDVPAQKRALEQLLTNLGRLGTVTLVDRRLTPSHGYRAIHLIAAINGKPVEVQLRTQLQHFWAEISETAADVFGIAVKYGGAAPGRPDVRESLDALSTLIADLESGAPHGQLPDQEQVVQVLTVALALVVAAATIRRDKS
jgi:putative GTP pyrophosphokinase